MAAGEPCSGSLGPPVKLVISGHEWEQTAAVQPEPQNRTTSLSDDAFVVACMMVQRFGVV